MLKKFWPLLTIINLSLTAFNSQAQVGEVQTNPTLAERIKFTASVSNWYEKVYRRPQASRMVLTDHFKTEVSLTLNASVTQNLVGVVQADVNKYWNSWVTQNRNEPGIYNLLNENKFSSSSFDLELGYFRYEPADFFRFYGGRLPTGNGNPENYWRGSAATSLFPKLAFGRNLDGFIGEFRYENISVGVGYAPYLIQNYSFGTSPTLAKATTESGSSEVENLGPQAFGFGKFEFEGNESFKSASILGQYRWINYLRFPDSTVDESFLGGANGTLAQLRSNLAIFLRTILVSGEIEDFLKKDISFNFSYLSTELQSQGRVRVTSGTFIGTDLGGFGTSNSDDTLKGSIYLFGLRHRARFLGENPTWLGYESLASTGDSIFVDDLSEDSTRFYESKGNAHHLYIIHEVTNHLTARVGLRLINQKHSPTSLGNVRDEEVQVQNYYAHVKFDF
ncbi:MAG: hypothetical protein IT289_11305 [Oligoflexia bacterium]|nr:hypothetical protein [Oligoflexia bacterium]